jgi:hypothetical protein
MVVVAKPIFSIMSRRKTVRRTAAVAALIAAWPCGALAQQPAQPAPAAPAPPQFQQSAEWSKLPRMQLERQFAGPLQDTVIQRLRDPVDGTVCYVYLPISVLHTPTTATGFVQYGPNSIGSINCLPNAPAAPAAAGRKQ